MKEDWLVNKISERFLNILIGFLGCVLIIVGILFVDEKPKTIFISIGASLVASAVVGYLASFYMFKQKAEKEITETWGLRAIYKTRQKMNESCDKLVTEHSRCIDIMAFGLRSLRHAKSKEIENGVKRGLRLRVLAVSPQSEYLKQQDKIERKTIGSTANDILQLQEWIEHLNEIRPGCAELRYYDSFPLEFYFRVDETLFVGPYQYGRDSQQTISSEYKDGQVFSFYTSYFSDLWADPNFCKDYK